MNWNSYDFLGLLAESLAHFTHCPYRLLVLDNSENPTPFSAPHTEVVAAGRNLGHGTGLNLACSIALERFSHPYLAIFDVDCHVLVPGWDTPLLKALTTFDLVGGRGVPTKPLRPACMVMRREMASTDWRATPGYHGHRKTPGGFDVACRAYYQMLAEGRRLAFLTPVRPNLYGTLNGEEWQWQGHSLVYHHWHGSTLNLPSTRADFPDHDLQADKEFLFKQVTWRHP